MTDPTGETITFDITAAGERSELELPRALVERLADEGDTPTGVVADVAQFDFTRRVYEAASGDEGDEGLRAIEADALACFESHFGTDFEALVEGTKSGEAEHDHGGDHRH